MPDLKTRLRRGTTPARYSGTPSGMRWMAMRKTEKEFLLWAGKDVHQRTPAVVSRATDAAQHLLCCIGKHDSGASATAVSQPRPASGSENGYHPLAGVVSGDRYAVGGL